ncbi:MAG: ThiF family adenylyltransferase [Pseudomonadota bacterium]
MSNEKFSYTEFTNRNIGFVTEAEQAKLEGATVFVCGTGGMGGAAILGLVRAGIGRLIIADLDGFEVSNLNRQVFAFIHNIEVHKAEATSSICKQINPEIDITVYHDDWPEHVEEAITQATIVINGTDDLAASLLLYRVARKLGRTVIDAYASPLPSIYVTKAGAPTPEERLGYPTVGTEWNVVSQTQREQSFLCEAEYIMINSSSRHHIDLELAGEVAAGRRSRMSFAPMVICTGMLMTYEAIAGCLQKSHGADHRGWFFNPYKARVEHPKSPLIAAVLRPIVRRFLNKMIES